MLLSLTLRALPVATFDAGENHVVEGGDKKTTLELVDWVYVVEHPSEGLGLIDAGYGRATAADPHDYPGKATAKRNKLKMGTPAADRLSEIGYRPEDVQWIVLTHMHHDHVGGVADFPNARLIVDEREWVAAQNKRPLGGYLPTPYEGRTAEHPRYVAEPYGPFRGHADVFGDGSLIAIPAAGHTKGSMLVVLTVSNRRFVFLGDTAWVDANLAGTPKGKLVRSVLETDWKAGMQVLDTVRTWQAESGMVVLPGHDPKNGDRLAPWPRAVR